MPAKTFPCAICNKTVSKRKSYVIDPATGSRACREHEETQSAVKDRKAEEERERQRQEQEFLEKQQRRRHKREAESANFWREQRARLHCQICHITGIKEDEWHKRILIASMKVEMKDGVWNPLDHERTRQEMLEPGDTRNLIPLRFYPCGRGDKHQRYLFAQVRWPENASRDIKEMVRSDRQLISMLEHILLCDNCAQKHKAKRKEIELTGQNLEVGLLQFEMLKPAFKAMAAVEIVREEHGL